MSNKLKIVIWLYHFSSLKTIFTVIVKSVSLSVCWDFQQSGTRLCWEFKMLKGGNKPLQWSCRNHTTVRNTAQQSRTELWSQNIPSYGPGAGSSAYSINNDTQPNAAHWGLPGVKGMRWTSDLQWKNTLLGNSRRNK